MDAFCSPHRYDLPPDVAPAIREALADAHDASRPGLGPVRVIRSGIATPWGHRGELLLEDGRRMVIEGRLPDDLPLGYHDFVAQDTSETTRLIVVPDRCPLPPQVMWGWAAQLYAARSAASWGIGDLGDLKRLLTWSAKLGAGMVMINPLGAVAPVLPQIASPYFPASRRFRNPLFLRIEDVPGADRLGPELARLAAAGRALNRERTIDRDAVFRLKDQALRGIWKGFGGDSRFDRFLQEQGAALDQFAAYCLLAERFGSDYCQWPAEYQRPESSGVREFAAAHPRELRYHQWLQWLLDQEMAAAAKSLTIVEDLPIGIAPGGADAWAWQDLLAKNVSVGAPPDAFNIQGQDWQLPPLVPHRLRAACYEPFVETIRAALRHSGGLRIDHVMGLFRLFWIPQGMPASRGVYIRYPAEEMLGILALEAQRAGAFVIGEDLGTVEPGVRERLAQAHVLSFRVLWFENNPPAEYPESAMAAVTTHDLPTVAGLWSGADLAAQRTLGLVHDADMRKLQEHVHRMLDLPDDAPPGDVVQRAYARLAEAPSQILSATLEDALAVSERPNMPGTIDQWPNWSLALPGGIEALESSDLPGRIAAALSRGR